MTAITRTPEDLVTDRLDHIIPPDQSKDPASQTRENRGRFFRGVLFLALLGSLVASDVTPSHAFEPEGAVRGDWQPPREKQANQTIGVRTSIERVDLFGSKQVDITFVYAALDELGLIGTENPALSFYLTDRGKLIQALDISRPDDLARFANQTSMFGENEIKVAVVFDLDLASELQAAGYLVICPSDVFSVSNETQLEVISSSRESVVLEEHGLRPDLAAFTNGLTETTITIVDIGKLVFQALRQSSPSDNFYQLFPDAEPL